MWCSLVIATRNRAAQLARSLAALPMAEIAQERVQVIVVDNASTDRTAAVIDAFADRSSGILRRVDAPDPGLSRARNAGIAAASGEIIVFTDDDCRIRAGYFPALRKRLHGTAIHYGSGQILPHSPDDDPRVATRRLGRFRTIPPRTAVPPGWVQGANMFFSAAVFRRAGTFDVDLGAGTPFPCEDIEMATRASFAGFLGALLPELEVVHAHGRRRGSAAAQATAEAYDRGRGAYIAKLLAEDIEEAWALWRRGFPRRSADPAGELARFGRELSGALAYVERRLAGGTRADRTGGTGR
ncbi:MAG: glycosyltransferase family 2 protein [Alphaproteobacteria bacterium]